MSTVAPVAQTASRVPSRFVSGVANTARTAVRVQSGIRNSKFLLSFIAAMLFLVAKIIDDFAIEKEGDEVVNYIKWFVISFVLVLIIMLLYKPAQQVVRRVTANF